MVRRASVEKTCEQCGYPFQVKVSHATLRKCCSRECSQQWRKIRYLGENNPNYGNRGDKCAAWKGGRKLSNYGYVLLYMPQHPNARPDGYILEHRYVMSETLGRPLLAEEDVHHIDGNKTNNHPDNLEVLSRGEHTRRHNRRKTIVRGPDGRITATKTVAE